MVSTFPSELEIPQTAPLVDQVTPEFAAEDYSRLIESRGYFFHQNEATVGLERAQLWIYPDEAYAPEKQHNMGLIGPLDGVQSFELAREVTDLIATGLLLYQSTAEPTLAAMRRLNTKQQRYDIDKIQEMAQSLREQLDSEEEFPAHGMPNVSSFNIAGTVMSADANIAKFVMQVAFQNPLLDDLFANQRQAGGITLQVGNKGFGGMIANLVAQAKGNAIVTSKYYSEGIKLIRGKQLAGE